MSRGRHRRPRTPHVSRHVSRLSVVLAAGGAGIATPLITAGSAQAAPAAEHAQVETQAQTLQQKAKKSEAAKQYTVAGGDTLYGIATAHDIKGGWSALYEANRDAVGADPDLIHPGDQLTLDAAKSGGTKGGAAPEGGNGEKSSSQSSADQASYPDNLDGWINEALAIMEQHGIPGTYEGIHRNIMRESGGDPSAANNWDINAQNGTPSIGLLQVIKPTFDAYHVEGTAYDQYDPVANIVAACNYAADRYGSIDNVNGPY